jgi:DNA (cytosine-5)-methyltransferase 1
MKILDLFCGAGGAAMGLHRVFPDAEITGVDIKIQPRYPFKFIQHDAVTFTLQDFDFIWASPPCQAYSMSTFQWRAKGRKYPNLINTIREQLVRASVPYVIENVIGAPLVDPVMLCGAMFGLKVYRHRLFESSFLLTAPEHVPHTVKQAKVGRPPQEGEFCNPVGHFPNLKYHQEAMGIHWATKAELAQAIPPAYSEYVAKKLIEFHMNKGLNTELLAQPLNPLT